MLHDIWPVSVERRQFSGRVAGPIHNRLYEKNLGRYPTRLIHSEQRLRNKCAVITSREWLSV